MIDPFLGACLAIVLSVIVFALLLNWYLRRCESRDEVDMTMRHSSQFQYDYEKKRKK